MNCTADSLVMAVLMDDMGMLTPGAVMDFGFSEEPDMDAKVALFGAYQFAIRRGMTDALALHNAVCDGVALTAILEPTGLLKSPVKCVKFEWDDFECDDNAEVPDED